MYGFLLCFRECESLSKKPINATKFSEIPRYKNTYWASDSIRNSLCKNEHMYCVLDSIKLNKVFLVLMKRRTIIVVAVLYNIIAMLKMFPGLDLSKLIESFLICFYTGVTVCTTRSPNITGGLRMCTHYCDLSILSITSFSETVHFIAGYISPRQE